MKRLAFIALLLTLALGNYTPVHAALTHGGDGISNEMGRRIAGYGSDYSIGGLSRDRVESRGEEYQVVGFGATSDSGWWLGQKPYRNASQHNNNWGSWNFGSFRDNYSARGATGARGAAEEVAWSSYFGLEDEGFFGRYRGSDRGSVDEGYFRGFQLTHRSAVEDWFVMEFMELLLANLHYPDRHDWRFRGEWHGWYHWGSPHHHWGRHHGHFPPPPPPPVPTPIPGAVLLLAPGLAAISFFRRSRRAQVVPPLERGTGAADR